MAEDKCEDCGTALTDYRDGHGVVAMCEKCHVLYTETDLSFLRLRRQLAQRDEQIVKLTDTIARVWACVEAYCAEHHGMKMTEAVAEIVGENEKMKEHKELARAVADVADRIVNEVDGLLQLKHGDDRIEALHALVAENEKMRAQDKAISVCKCKTCEEYVPGRYLRDGVCPSCLKAENKRLKVKVEIALEWVMDYRHGGVQHWNANLDRATTNRMNADAHEKGGG